MTDTETEAETLERLELALKRIGEMARQPKPANPDAASGPEIDRAASAALTRLADQPLAKRARIAQAKPRGMRSIERWRK